MTTIVSWIALVAGFGFLRSRRRKLRLDVPGISWRETRRLEIHTNRILDRLGKALDLSPYPPYTALDAHAAASAVIDRDDLGLVDIAGVAALAQMGLGALEGKFDLRLCFFHHAHGWATTDATYEPTGQTVALPTCSECADAIARGAEPESALDGDQPYWQRDTIWARTGFGSIDPNLARDILAGKR